MNEPSNYFGQQIDVLIVGAGPTGLMAAIELARRGITARIIERAPTRSPHSKAMVVHSRTLEVLNLVSPELADTFVRRGYPTPGIAFISNSAHPVHVEMQHLPTRFPYVLVLPQTETEELLARYLTEQGRTVERGSVLLDLSQDREWVTAHIQDAYGKDEFIRARYVIGADGTHSAVRHGLNVPFKGKGYGWTAFLGDVQVTGDLKRGSIVQYSSPRGLAFIVPFRNGSFRIMTLDAAYQNYNRADELSLELFQSSVDAIVPLQLKLHDPIWLTPWSAQLRQVDQYRFGRVFLAGDAAHAHSPAGGQGLNTSIQDAFNLAWKLAFVLQQRAPESLLDTYNMERHPVGQRVMRLSDWILRSLLVRNPTLIQIRELALKTLLPITAIQREVSENISEIKINYRSATRAYGQRGLSHGSNGSGALPQKKHAIQAGDRIPDVELEVLGNSQRAGSFIPLSTLLCASAYTLLIVLSIDQFQQDREQLKNLVRQLKERAAETVDCSLVVAQGLPIEWTDEDIPVLLDFKQQLHQKFGAEHGSIFLLRPDGYLAFAVKGFSWPALARALQPWLHLKKGALSSL